MKKIVLPIALFIVLFSSCKKETVVAEHDGQATLKLDAIVGTEDFSLNKNFTINERTYNFNELRYWVSNIILVNATGGQYKVPNAYYLVEETAELSIQDGSFLYPATKREDIEIENIPVGEYKSVIFSLGVDQKYNDNLSLQAGELSQLNGMTNISWMWHTTYIFSALGGTITAGGTTEDIKVETGLNANYKTITLDFPAAVKISSVKSTAIDLNLDITKILDGVDLVATPVIGAAQATEMAAVANNYATKAFSIKAAR